MLQGILATSTNKDWCQDILRIAQALLGEDNLSSSELSIAKDELVREMLGEALLRPQMTQRLVPFCETALIHLDH
jgi:hypothetical protein